MKHLELVIEIGKDGSAWGRTSYKKAFFAHNADTQAKLIKELPFIISDQTGLKPSEIKFNVAYDITSFFNSEANFFNVSELAKVVGVAPSLMRSYVAGTKHPSTDRLKQIQTAVRDLGKRLSKANFSASVVL